ncbi:MAG: hypothetical protein K9I69_07180 [Ignavibacteriales bacterium]|nr:hypothetical protein [Ignavibacteriales bacterium]MCF8305448.1 hypothetical protein [Ignavibacteriales bacterium]MCF8316131.1 hypothetical protein [Ignavibacteriales bacterium]MCF8436633.1 hypothetical protein [Ignavibacteriales bacterium]
MHNSFTLSGALATDYSWNYYKFEILLAGNKITLRDTTISDLFKFTDVPSGSYSLSVLADSAIIKDTSIIINKNMSVLIPITGSKPANDLIVFSRGTGYMDDDFLWIMDMNGSNWHKQIPTPYSDHFTISGDGRFMVFVKKWSSVIQRYDFDTGMITDLGDVFFDSGVQEPIVISPMNDVIAYQQFYDRPTFTRNIILLNLNDNSKYDLTLNDGLNIEPSFSPSGTKLVFTSSKNDSAFIETVKTDGTERTKRYGCKSAYSLRMPFFVDENSIIFQYRDELKTSVVWLNLLSGTPSELFTNINRWANKISISNDSQGITGETDEGKLWYMSLRTFEIKILGNGEYPVLNSDSRFVIFHRNVGINDYDIFKLEIKTGTETNLTRSSGFDLFPHIKTP